MDGPNYALWKEKKKYEKKSVFTLKKVKNEFQIMKISELNFGCYQFVILDIL